MFFVISKLIAFLTFPLTWIIAAIAYGFYTKNKKRKKRSFIAAGVLFIFFSNAVVFDVFMGLWEVSGKRADDMAHYEVGVVLGGMSEWDSNLERLSFRRGSDRLWQAVHLYKMGKIDKILISGANGSLFEDDLNEAAQMKAFLLEIGLPEKDILVEGESRNTHENANMTGALLAGELPDAKRILLITSGSHMRRARACFREEGMNVDTYSTDLYTGGSPYITVERLLLPNIGVMENWNILIHELTGYLTYAVMGYL